jgi:hypothetical protein
MAGYQLRMADCGWRICGTRIEETEKPLMNADGR